MTSPNTSLPELSAFSLKARSSLALLTIVIPPLLGMLGIDVGAVMPSITGAADHLISAVELLLPVVGGIWLWIERRAPNYRLVLGKAKN